MLTRKLLSVIDNIVVDVLKIICCSESTDSFMVNITVAQLPGHSRGTRFYSRGPCPGWPPLGAATASDLSEKQWCSGKSRITERYRHGERAAYNGVWGH